MGKVYKSEKAKTILMALYEKQLSALNYPYTDIQVATRFGKTHLIKLGNPSGKPVLIFHGGNSTTPYNLMRFAALLKHFCVYAVDTIGHPGKSDETILSPKSADYGEWASDVIDGLGFSQMCCMGVSYGGGILVKLMSVAPEKVEKSVLIVPSGISNVSTLNVMVKMGVPMLLYTLTKSDYWLNKAILPMAVDKNNIDAYTKEMIKISFECAVVKVGMPSNIPLSKLEQCSMPVFLIAAEDDCLFPGKKVIERAKHAIPKLTTKLIANQGHLCVLPQETQTMIMQFING